MLRPMIVCVCKAVSDRHIKAAVEEGATCMRDLTRDLGVGTCCGKCIPEARTALSQCLGSCEFSTSNIFSPAPEFAA
jgi:bacterioferritin-associated ferredoxin